MKLGIDFGTCFSFMATMIGSDVRTTLVDDVDKYSGIPTLFMHTKQNQDYYGRDAFNRLKDNPQDCIKEIKKDIRIHPERITPAATYKYPPLGEQYYKPETIVELFIKYLIETAKKNARAQGIVDCNDIDEITITAPVGLNSDYKAKEATALYNEMLIRVAKKTTGINDNSRIHILGEPIAAAMYNIRKHNAEGKQTILVYDLGGGTFDSAIVEYNPNSTTKEKYDAISTGGYTDVGGGDWDNCLKEIVKNKTHFSGEQTIERGYVPKDPVDRAVFENEIVEAKIYLSTHNRAVVDFEVDRNIYSATISREEFEKASEKYLEKTMKIVDDVLRGYEDQKGLSAGQGINSINRIVLVGGASQMPQVRQRLLKKFPKFENRIYLDEPQLAIAAGAAINNAAPVVPKVLHTYGIDCHQRSTDRDRINNIIYKGTLIYGDFAADRESYQPRTDTQTAVAFNVYVSDVLKGEDEIEDNRGWIDFDGRQPLFGYSVDVPSEYSGRATQYGIIAEFRILKNGTVELYTYEKDERKEDNKGKEIHHDRFPK